MNFEGKGKWKPMKNSIENICVYGVGGVGGYFGAKMIENNTSENIKITFVARGKHLEEIRKNGLVLCTDGKKIQVFPDYAVENANEIKNIDLVVLCVKSYDLREALENIKPKVADNTIILPLLNGVDIYERIRQTIDLGVVLPACVYVGTHVEKAGVIKQSGGDGKIVFGNDPLRNEDSAENVCRLFEFLNINYKYEENPYTHIWTKYMFISAYGLVTASTGKMLGEILEDNDLLNNVRAIMNEIKQIADKKNIILDANVIESSLDKAKSFSYETKTSYQRDVEMADKKNEGDLFGGTIVRLGMENSVDTSITQKYYEKLKA